MDKKTHEIIKTARPKLKDAFPLTAAMVLVFGYGNLLIGAGLMSERAHLSHFLTINAVTNSVVWGIIFVLLGAFMLWGYLRNEWGILRRTLFIALLVKTFWMVSLLVRLVNGMQDNVLIPVIWGMLLAAQFVTYVYFQALPRGNE